MNKIILEKARAKNFLSFGNNWQEISFPPGMNLVQGLNVDSGKSNGSGKSSLTEMVSFAFFGKTIKDLPQAKVINWFNRGGCKVELYFRIGEDRYVFQRSLKPNKFKVVFNDKDIVRPADIKSFQYQMENDVIGMDFKTFKNLIYFSPNNTISILGAKKEAKRQFLESLFDLSEYSDMLKITNTKIGGLSEKVRDCNHLIDTNNQVISLIQKDIDETKEIDFTAIHKKINELTLLQEGLSQLEFEDVDSDLDTLRELLDILNKNHLEYTSIKADLTARIKSTQESIDNTDIDTPTRQRNELHKQIDDLQLEIDSAIDTEESIADDMVQAKEEIEDYVNEKKRHKESITEMEKAVQVSEYVVKGCESSISTIRARMSNMDGKDVCDFCGSEVTPDHLTTHFENQIAEHSTELQKHLDIITENEERISTIKDLCDTIDTSAKDLASEYSELKTKLQRLDKIRSDIKILEEKQDLIPDVAKLTVDLMVKKQEVDDLQKQLRDIEWKFDMNKEDIETKDKRIKDLDVQKEERRKHLIRVDDINKQLENQQDRLDELQQIADETEVSIKTKKIEINQKSNEIDSTVAEITRYNKMLDHLNYLRVSLKDENVKQFAISALLPYLNQRANYYLSESGFPYIVYIDGWLDVIIRGMGTEDVGYNSLSGGESKAMDMAIQLACGDIAELHAKTLLGISIYDEILDTSLDADGVSKLMSIIKVKQRDTDNCVLCITHRDEIKELDFDNYIMVEKENGFSTITNN